MQTSFLDLCLKRRSIRRYEEREVSSEQLDYILSCALTAPSSKASRPWEFVVVRNRAVLAQLSQCRTYGSQLLCSTSLAIVVCVDPSLTDTWQLDGAIAAEHLLLAAEDQGLGGCWVQILNRGTDEGDNAEEAAKQLLGIPEQLRVICAVSIGYKAEERKVQQKDKLLYSKIHYGKF